jgi:hypothetical protein
MQPRLLVPSPLLIGLFMWIAACLRIGASSTGPTKSGHRAHSHILAKITDRDVFQHGAGVVMAEWRCNHENAFADWFESAYLAEDWDNGSFHEIRGIQIITSATGPSSEASRDSSGPRLLSSISTTTTANLVWLIS